MVTTCVASTLGYTRWTTPVIVAFVVRPSKTLYMGVEPFLLSSSLIAVMAQRLVRLLCIDCRESAEATFAERELLGIEVDEPIELYHSKGCAKCNMTGYRGRTGIYELIEVDDALRTAIHEGVGEQGMLKIARMNYPGIQADGKRRILAGETTLEEVLRVTSVK